MYREARALFEQDGDAYGAALSDLYLGLIDAEAGRYEDAAVRLREALPVFRRMHFTQYASQCIGGIAAVVLAREQPQEATRLFAAASALRSRSGIAPTVVTLWEREQGAARVDLGEAAFATAWAEGLALRDEEALDRAQLADLHLTAATKLQRARVTLGVHDRRPRDSTARAGARRDAREVRRRTRPSRHGGARGALHRRRDTSCRPPPPRSAAARRSGASGKPASTPASSRSGSSRPDSTTTRDSPTSSAATNSSSNRPPPRRSSTAATTYWCTHSRTTAAGAAASRSSPPAPVPPEPTACLPRFCNAPSSPSWIDHQSRGRTMHRTRIATAVLLAAATACTVALTANASKSNTPPCTPKITTIGGHKAAVNCGPATATLRIGGKTYTFRDGFCEQSKSTGAAPAQSGDDRHRRQRQRRQGRPRAC